MSHNFTHISSGSAMEVAMSSIVIPSQDPNHYDPLLADPDMQDDINAAMGLDVVGEPPEIDPETEAWLASFDVLFDLWLEGKELTIDYSTQPPLQ